MYIEPCYSWVIRQSLGKHGRSENILGVLLVGVDRSSGTLWDRRCVIYRCGCVNIFVRFFISEGEIDGRSEGIFM